MEAATGAAHTPGPWVWRDNTLAPETPDFPRSNVHTILDAEGGYGFLGSDRHATSTELEADRRLIASAPELLAALERLHAICLGMDLERQDDRPSEGDYQGAMWAAEVAISMAVWSAA